MSKWLQNNFKTTENAQAVYEDYCKCSDLALRMDSLDPTAEGAFTGTVSERLQRSFERLLDRALKAEREIERIGQ